MLSKSVGKLIVGDKPLLPGGIRHRFVRRNVEFQLWENRLLLEGANR